MLSYIYRLMVTHFRQSLLLALAFCFGVSAVAQARHVQVRVQRFRLPAGIYGGPEATYATNTMTVGPDGNIWFVYGKGYSSKYSSGIARITPTGHVTLFPVKVGAGEVAGAISIVSGPDDALWFTLVRSIPSRLGLDEPESVDGAIGRITTAGAMTLFPLPNPMEAGARIPCNGTFRFCPAEAVVTPFSLAVGAEGDIWAAGGLDTIWRVTPAGEVMTFHTPTSSSWPDGIALGPNGWLWFTETTMNQFFNPPGALAYITPSGAITELSGIHAKAAGHRITAGMVFGPNHTLWVGGEGFIAKVTGAGRVTTYPLRGNAFNGTRDGMGNVWFGVSGIGSRYADRLAEIRRGSARPVLVGPVLSALHSPVGAGIAATPGGKLWLLGDGSHWIECISIK